MLVLAPTVAAAQFGEDTWEEQVVREYYLSYHRLGQATMELYRTLPGDTCAGECPEGCECERTMATTREVARYAYGKLWDAQLGYVGRGLDVPFNWDGAVELNMAEIHEEDGNAVMALQCYARFLDRRKERDISTHVAMRKVHAMRQQAIGVAAYEFPVH